MLTGWGFCCCVEVTNLELEWLGAVFAAERWTGTPRLCEPDKHDGLGWYPVAALPETTIGYVRQAIRAYQDVLRMA